MSDSSPVLSLPLIQPAQAQKHVTHNEALQRLDVLVQLVLKGVGALVPPPAPAGGDVYALGIAPSGLWAGYGGMLAAYLAGEWQFLAPRPGWQGWDAAGGTLRIWTGSAWKELTSQMALDNLARLGVATTSDTVNRLAVSSPATLLTHAGAGHQVKVNKATAGHTASLLYQTGFSGRAEIGLAGNDNFSVKVSADGSAWTEALVIDRATGRAGGAAVQSGPADDTAGALLTSGAFGWGMRNANANLPAYAGNDLNLLRTNGVWRTLTGTQNIPVVSVSQVLHMGQVSDYAVQVFFSTGFNRIFFRRMSNGTWGVWQELRSTANTTVDSNGFIKAASPIVRLYADRIEEPVQATGAVLTRLSEGVYILADTLGLAHEGWRIEVPKDHNGNRLCHVATAWEDGLLRLTVTTPIWAGGAWSPGEPMDVPQGRWIDIRLHEREN